MKTYLVKLTPLEPYFFGNEKTFLFRGEKNQGQRGNSYYIRSERTPLQSTLMGMMRYLLMPYRDHRHYEENAAVIGKESFRIDACDQSFGVIRQLHPLFLMKGDQRYIVTPFDAKPGQETYIPFSDYRVIETDRGEKRYAAEYDAKRGLADSYLCLADGTTVDADQIFGTETRAGNRKSSGSDNSDSFFKKEYGYLKDGFCFAFYADLNDDAVIPENGRTSAFLGQGKSLFSVEFIEENNTVADDAARYIPDDILYCMSDVYCDATIDDRCLFAVIRDRDYRTYETGRDGRIAKGSTLYKLIKAGSVFLTENKEELSGLLQNADCRKAGFNCIVSGRKTRV